MVLSNLGRHGAALEALESIPQHLLLQTYSQFQYGLVHADTLMWLDRWQEGRAQLDDILRHFAPDL
ncbi:MAG: hypothetical protein R3F36_16305 [Candidatus Competibacteraceae bacterium]